MAVRKSGDCDACGNVIGLWQAVFTAECAHTFHLRCVSGAAACPFCAAPWADTPASAPAPAPATTFTFASTTTTPVFGQATALTSLHLNTASSPPSSSTSLFGQPPAFGLTSTSTTHSSCPTLASSPPPSSTGLVGESAAFGMPWPSTTQNTFSSPIAAFGENTPSPTGAPPCPVCRVAMRRGEATVTSECDHTFHFRCISRLASSACPVCSARWRDCVSMAPPPQNPFSSPPKTPMFGPFNPAMPLSLSLGGHLQPHSADHMARPGYDDDEPVEPSPPLDVDGWDLVPDAPTTNNGRLLVLKTHCENPAVARDTARDNFAVLVHAKAPAAAEASPARASLDLVTVLDVSGSMAGYKLALLKQAMAFVINHLGPGDRLSVVAFSNEARRIIRLTRMSEGGKASAKAAVESLVAGGGTNIGAGLLAAAEILDGRRHRNPVASVILLSDGHDNYNYTDYRSRRNGDLVPLSLRRSDDDSGRRPPPVHTFGFGTDHDAAAMHAIAEVTGGTFSFIENQAVVQDSFAQCIGGLLSVAVQEARVAVECLHPGVRVRHVKSGRYESVVDLGGRAASVDVGELYADEERRFLLFLDVPVAAAGGDGAEDDGSVTRLIRVSCAYKDAATGRPVDVSCEDDAAVQRPVVVPPDMTEPCVEVARERFRVEAAEDIAAARLAADRGEYARAVQILARRQEASAASAVLADDERCAELVAELRELSARVADRPEYEKTGRACLLAGMSSHAQQRASTVQLNGAAAPAFGTTARTPAGSGFGATPAFGTTVPAFGTPPAGSAFGATPAFGTPPAGSAFGATPAFGTSANTSPFGATAGSTFGATTVVSLFTSLGCPPQAAPAFGSRFATPAMQSMVESSRNEREQHPTEGGSSSQCSLFGSN